MPRRLAWEDGVDLPAPPRERVPPATPYGIMYGLLELERSTTQPVVRLTRIQLEEPK